MDEKEAAQLEEVGPAGDGLEGGARLLDDLSLRPAEDKGGEDVAPVPLGEPRLARAGMAGRELQGDQAADRDPHQRGPLDPQVIKQRPQVLRELNQAVGSWRTVGQPMAAQVVAEDGEIGFQGGDDLIPKAQIGAQRIDQDQRQAVGSAGARVVDDVAIQGGEHHSPERVT